MRNHSPLFYVDVITYPRHIPDASQCNTIFWAEEYNCFESINDICPFLIMAYIQMDWSMHLQYGKQNTTFPTTNILI